MHTYLLHLKRWYTQLSTKERLLLLALSFLLIYAIFYFAILRGAEKKHRLLLEEINTTEQQQIQTKLQIDVLKKIGESPLYKTWQQQNKLLQTMQTKYSRLIHTPSQDEWQNILRSILEINPAITIAQIKNFPESEYKSTNGNSLAAKLYQQRLLIVFYGNYFDTLDFLTGLEKALPTLHWASLSYQVVQYPIAKIELELAILYEKT